MRRYCAKPCFFKARRERDRIRIGAAYRARLSKRPGPRLKPTPSFMAIPPHELAVPEPGWQSDPRRGCEGLTNLFFAPKAVARQVQVETDALCAGCVVRESCLTWALLEGDVVYGRIAGTSPDARRRYRRKYGVKAPTLTSVEMVINPIIEAIKLRRKLADALPPSVDDQIPNTLLN